MRYGEWKFAFSAYLVARVALSAWAFVVALLFPVVLQNLDLFGAPTLAVFDLASGERYAYSREVDGTAFTFRAGDSGFAADTQTGSTWSLREGRAVSGKYAGRALSASSFSVEDIFPYRGVAIATNVLLSVWQRFDANWYLKIAERGYASDDGSMVYFPLYPSLIRVVGALVGNSLLAALLISNLSLIGALALLYRLSDALFGAASARRALAYWLLFPTAFFLTAAYTESLFLLFTLAAFDFARRDKWMLAALFGALAALTRLQGALLVAPLAYLWWQNDRRPPTANHHITQHATRIAPLLLIPLATAAFLAFTHLSLLSSYVGELHARFVWPWDNLAASIALLASGRASFVDALNLLTTIGFGAMMFAVWRALPREYSLYALLMYFAPLFRMTTTQPLVSMDRYALAIFPVFMLWGARGKNAWINRAV
ncbi:MAG: glycosyltransferase family 39 protein, partial [Chloroflexota bacterium]